MNKILTVTEYLCKHLPTTLTLQIVKDCILKPSPNFIDFYFPSSVKCMLIWRKELFTEKGLKRDLTYKERLQLIGIISLCRYSLRDTFLDEIKAPFPDYNNDYLHTCLEAANVKELVFSDFLSYSIESLSDALPKQLTKDFLANKCFEKISKTSRLIDKHFTKEVLMVFNLPTKDYKNIRVFNEVQRLRIIGLIAYFQIPLKKSLLKFKISI